MALSMASTQLAASRVSATSSASQNVKAPTMSRTSAFFKGGASAAAFARRAPKAVRVARKVECGGSQSATSVAPMSAANLTREVTRIAIPSKGRMAEDTQALLAACQLKVKKTNPRQYVATIGSLPGVEVWFQRASDVVRRMRAGDVDIGILGGDMFEEFGEGDDELVVIHEALNFGHCHLSLGVPTTGKWEHIDTLADLKGMSEFTPERPLRVVTGYHYIAKEYFAKVGMTDRVQLLAADGALEAAPKMDYADIILDLVSTGTTLRENNLKELAGEEARIIDSEGVLVARRSALLNQPEALKIVRELLERFEAHLKAEDQYTVVANMRGTSREDVAQKIMDADPLLMGLQGPTISMVYTPGADGKVTDGNFYAVTVCVPQMRLFQSVKAFRQIGGSGIMVSPLTYIFDEQPRRWSKLLEDLGISDYDNFVPGMSKN